MGNLEREIKKSKTVSVLCKIQAELVKNIKDLSDNEKKERLDHILNNPHLIVSDKMEDEDQDEWFDALYDYSEDFKTSTITNAEEYFKSIVELKTR